MITSLSAASHPTTTKTYHQTKPEATDGRIRLSRSDHAHLHESRHSLVTCPPLWEREPGFNEAGQRGDPLLREWDWHQLPVLEGNAPRQSAAKLDEPCAFPSSTRSHGQSKVFYALANTNTPATKHKHARKQTQTRPQANT